MSSASKLSDRARSAWDGLSYWWKRPWVEGDQRGKHLRIAGALVAVVWLASLVTVLISGLFNGWVEGLAQAGDFFNIANALFTGAALAGLVYTAVMQHEQSAMQREELEGQREDSKESAKALQRQSREQFLTARINAAVALMNACEVRRGSLGNSKPDDWERVAIGRTTDVLRQQINVLMCEAQLGFEGGPWSSNVEAESLKRFVVELLSSAAFNVELKKVDPERAMMWLRTECELLRARCQDRFPGVYGYLGFLMDTLSGTDPSGMDHQQFSSWVRGKAEDVQRWELSTS